MSWTRDFTCNNLDCKNFKVKIDAMAARNFCGSCSSRIQHYGLCLFCAENNINEDSECMFPWLCKKCGEASKEAKNISLPQDPLAKVSRPVRQREESLARQLPGPMTTLIIIIVLSVITISIGSEKVGWFLLILIALFALWLPIALIISLTRED